MKKYLFSLLLLCAPFLAAHEINTSYTEIDLNTNDQVLGIELTLNHEDLSRIFGVPFQDVAIDSSLLTARLPEMLDYFKRHYKLHLNGKILELQAKSAISFIDELGKNLVRFSYKSTIPEFTRTLTVSTDFYENLNPLHKNLILIKVGDQIQQAVLSEDFPSDIFHLDDPNLSIFTKSIHFIWLGIEHIFIGYDHILFLLGVILLGGRFINLVKFVTAFTIAHSLTLVLAALEVVVLPPRFVESLIALSIVYIAVENFFVKDTEQRWMITFIFGLIHGFGFAGVLTELGLPQNGLVAALLSFNIGVEIGQVVIVALLYPLILLGLKQRWQRQFIYSVSSVILVFGLLWFIERAFDVPVAFL